MHTVHTGQIQPPFNLPDPSHCHSFRLLQILLYSLHQYYLPNKCDAISREAMTFEQRAFFQLLRVIQCFQCSWYPTNQGKKR